MRRFGLLGLDLLLLGIAAIFALLLRENLVLEPSKVAALLPYLAASLAVAIPIKLLFGLDRTFWRYSVMVDYIRVVVAVCCIVLAATLLTFLLNRMDGISRSIPILQGLLGICLLVGARIAVRSWYANRPRELAKSEPLVDTERNDKDHDPSAISPRGLLIVGLTPLTVLYLRAVSEFAPDRFRVAGIIPHAADHAGRLVRQHRVFDTLTDLPDVLRTLEVHGVFVDNILVTVPYALLPSKLQEQLASVESSSAIQIDYLLEQLGIEAQTGPLSRRQSGSDQRLEARDVQPAAFRAALLQRGMQRPYWRWKRVFDATLAGVALIILAPVIAVLACVIAGAIGFPTIFWQDRPGLGGKPFRLYKFRTMSAAHDRHGHRIPDAERVNAVGQFLRATRLDELPQLWNILIGDMAFVGPRPLLHVDQPASYASRLLARPGLTGWAQVIGGRQVTPSDKAALDVWYVQNASLLLDLRIVALTIPILLFGERISRNDIDRAWQDLVRSGVCEVVIRAKSEDEKTSCQRPDALQETSANGATYNRSLLTGIQPEGVHHA